MRIDENREVDENVSDWHNSADFNDAVQRFHDKYAREPREKIAEAMKIHRSFMLEIERHFQRRGICQYLEYTGSSYEGVKVRKSSEDDDLEFDVMMIINRHSYNLNALKIEDKPGYAWLQLHKEHQASPGLNKVLGYWDIFGVFTGQKYVDAYKTMDVFESELQKCINDSTQMKGTVKLRRHGPAIQLDVHPDSGVLLWGPRLFSVDIVPTYSVGGELYVSKPIKGECMPNDMTWRISYSLEEKSKLHGSYKNVLRVLKVLRNRESGLAKLTSYHLKTAVFYHMVYRYEDSDTIGKRLLAVLGILEHYLGSGNFPHYFIPEINLLSSISNSTRSNIQQRIKRLRTSRKNLEAILKA